MKSQLFSLFLLAVLISSAVPINVYADTGGVAFELPTPSEAAQAPPTVDYTPEGDVKVTLYPGQNVINVGLTAEELKAQGCKLSKFQGKDKYGAVVDISTDEKPFLSYSIDSSENSKRKFVPSSTMEDKSLGYFVPLSEPCDVTFKAPNIADIEYTINLGMNVVSFPVDISVAKLKEYLAVTCPSIEIAFFSGGYSTNEKPFVVYDPNGKDKATRFVQTDKITKYMGTYIPVMKKTGSTAELAAEYACSFKLHPSIYDPNAGKYTAVEFLSLELPAQNEDGPAKQPVTNPVNFGCDTTNKESCGVDAYCGNYYKFDTAKRVYYKNEILATTCVAKKELNEDCDYSYECKSGFCEIDPEVRRHAPKEYALIGRCSTPYADREAYKRPVTQQIAVVESAPVTSSNEFANQEAAAQRDIDENTYTLIIETGNGYGYPELGLAYNNQEASDKSDAKTSSPVSFCVARNPETYLLGVSSTFVAQQKSYYKYANDKCVLLNTGDGIVKGPLGATATRVETIKIPKNHNGLKYGPVYQGLYEGDEVYLKSGGDDAWALRQFVLYHKGKKIAFGDFRQHKNMNCPGAAVLVPGGQLWMGTGGATFSHPSSTKDCYSLSSLVKDTTGVVIPRSIDIKSYNTNTLFMPFQGTDVVKESGY